LDHSVRFGFHGGRRAISFSEPYSVNQGVWIDVLAQMGYQHTLLVEVPMPDHHPREAWQPRGASGKPGRGPAADVRLDR
jgi:hypothetical protein